MRRQRTKFTLVPINCCKQWQRKANKNNKREREKERNNKEKENRFPFVKSMQSGILFYDYDEQSNVKVLFDPIFHVVSITEIVSKFFFFSIFFFILLFPILRGATIDTDGCHHITERKSIQLNEKIK